MAKQSKKRASKYEKKLSLGASFEDIIKLSVMANKKEGIKITFTKDILTTDNIPFDKGEKGFYIEKEIEQSPAISCMLVNSNGNTKSENVIFNNGESKKILKDEFHFFRLSISPNSPFLPLTITLVKI